LFIIVMTVLMGDAVAMLSPTGAQAFKDGSLFDVLYADATILLGSSPALVQEFAKAAQQAGAGYGLSLNWGKTQAVSVGAPGCLQNPDGSQFDDLALLEYLGGLISRDGRADSEISRKIGRAYADFRSLRSLWSHAGVSRSEKVRYFETLVLSRLAYGLSTQWLVTSQRRRLDGFVARCLRRLLGIPAAFISRISNATVYSRAGMRSFPDQLLKQQLLMLGKVALSPQGSPIRNNTFVDGSVLL